MSSMSHLVKFCLIKFVFERKKQDGKMETNVHVNYVRKVFNMHHK